MAVNALKDKNGFTLLEALIAIALLVLMMLALWRSAAMIMNRNVENSLADEAVKIANEEIENLRNMPFSSLSHVPTSKTEIRKVRNFNQTFTVNEALNATSTSVYVTTITVNWTYGGKPHSYSATTVIADHG